MKNNYDFRFAVIPAAVYKDIIKTDMYDYMCRKMEVAALFADDWFKANGGAKGVQTMLRKATHQELRELKDGHMPNMKRFIKKTAHDLGKRGGKRGN